MLSRYRICDGCVVVSFSLTPEHPNLKGSHSGSRFPKSPKRPSRTVTRALSAPARRTDPEQEPGASPGAACVASVPLASRCEKRATYVRTVLLKILSPRRVLLRTVRTADWTSAWTALQALQAPNPTSAESPLSCDFTSNRP